VRNRIEKAFITLPGIIVFGLKTLEAYVLIKIATQTDVCGFSRSVIEKIGKMNGIEKVSLLFGDFDAILKVSLPKTHDIENMVMEDIHMVEGVESTLTLLCVDEKVIE
jgi:DNA-binding Lrp family transcriptional regulator